MHLTPPRVELKVGGRISGRMDGDKKGGPAEQGGGDHQDPRGSMHKPDGPGIDNGCSCFALAGTGPPEPKSAAKGSCFVGSGKGHEVVLAGEDALNLETRFL